MKLWVKIVIAALAFAGAVLFATHDSGQDSRIASQNARISQLAARVAQLQNDQKATKGGISELGRLWNKQRLTLASLSKPAQSSHLGFCASIQYDSTFSYVTGVTIAPPSNAGGVPSCPTGSFVSIVPGG